MISIGDSSPLDASTLITASPPSHPISGTAPGICWSCWTSSLPYFTRAEIERSEQDTETGTETRTRTESKTKLFYLPHTPPTWMDACGSHNQLSLRLLSATTVSPRTYHDDDDNDDDDERSRQRHPAILAGSNWLAAIKLFGTDTLTATVRAALLYTLMETLHL